MNASIGSALGTSKTQDYVLLALLALVGYVVFEAIKGVKTVAGAAGAAAHAIGAGVRATGVALENAYSTTTSALGSGFYKIFGPDDAATLSNSTYLMVNFPNGSHHAVPANTVNSSGLFIWTGYPPGSQPSITLTLVKDNQGAWYATSDTPMPLDASSLQPVQFDPTSISSDLSDIHF